MRRWSVAIGTWAHAAGLLAGVGCRGEGAQRMLETAKFEELQRNEEHARILYERVVANYPDSQEAAFARQRRAELGSTETD